MDFSFQKSSDCDLCIFEGERGLTLISVLVSVSITVLFAAILIGRQRSFEGSIELTNVTYQVASQIREAQILSTGAKSVGTAFDYPHAVEFDMEKPDQFVLFADKNDNGELDTGNDEAIRTSTFRGAYSIAKVCVTEGGGKESCSDSSDMSRLVVQFDRPDTAPNFYAYDSLGNPVGSPSDYVSGEVTISASGESTRLITISHPGQVTVSNPSADSE